MSLMPQILLSWHFVNDNKVFVAIILGPGLNCIESGSKWTKLVMEGEDDKCKYGCACVKKNMACGPDSRDSGLASIAISSYHLKFIDLYSKKVFSLYCGRPGQGVWYSLKSHTPGLKFFSPINWINEAIIARSSGLRNLLLSHTCSASPCRAVEW